MTPRSGGEADKFGNRYEGRWTVFHTLQVLAGQFRSLVVEEVGVRGEGVEFRLEHWSGAVEAHQLKRQRKTANSWSVNNLADAGIFSAALSQQKLNRDFHFVSTLPSEKLAELCDRARRTDGSRAFVDQLDKTLGPVFDQVKPHLGGRPDEVFRSLQRFFIRWPDEASIVSFNAALAGLLIAGAPGPAASVVIGDLVLDNLGRTLDAAFLQSGLEKYQLSSRDLRKSESNRDAVTETYARWLASVERELLRPTIVRPEVADVARAVRAAANRLTLVLGAAGDGKTGVLAQAVSQLAAERPVLALRLDRLEPFSSAHQLGEQLGLTSSPVASLAAAAAGSPSLLVMDQLDAVSRVSGRLPEAFDTVAELIREASAFPEMDVLLASREFDVKNDDRLRTLLSDDSNVRKVPVGPVAIEQVHTAVTAMGIDPDRLSAVQTEVLRSPLSLVLFHSIADAQRAIDFRSLSDLLAAFWDRKRRDCESRRPGTRFAETIRVLAAHMSDRQQLSAPLAALDEANLAAEAETLASEHVLSIEGRLASFFHEAFFDYAFARRWLTENSSLVAFLVDGDQELFRRAQVRQVLTLMRDDEPAQFGAQVADLLTDPEVRYHLKEVVLAIVRGLPDPAKPDLVALTPLLEEGTPMAARLWEAIRTPGWFALLDSEQDLASRLIDQSTRVQTLGVIDAAPPGSPRVAELLASIENQADRAAAATAVARINRIGHSRPYFELILDLITSRHLPAHDRDFWITTAELAGERPTWASELVEAWLQHLTPDGDVNPRFPDLQNRDYWLLRLVEESAQKAPIEFATRVVPQILRIARHASEGHRRPVHDREFSFRMWNADIHAADDAIFAAACNSLALAASSDPSAIGSLLQTLAETPLYAAQVLLYEALAAAGEQTADWAAEILLQGPHRLEAGYDSSPFWTTRKLLSSISPHVRPEKLAELQGVILSFSPNETPKRRGYASFQLLSALPLERMTAAGKKRLGEYRRKFGPDEPAEPIGLMSGFVQSPIPAEASEQMTDKNWLAAMAKHVGEGRERFSLIGGAEELANELRSRTVADPTRFSRLALQLPDDIPTVYPSAILHGLANPAAEAEVDVAAAVNAITFLAQRLRVADFRAVAWAADRYAEVDLPDELLAMLLDEAENGDSSGGESWETMSDGSARLANPYQVGINTSQGAAVVALASYCAHDVDGQRTGRLQKHFPQLAEASSIAVRSCVAQLLTAGLRHARPAVVAATRELISADAQLLATEPVQRLLVFTSEDDPRLIDGAVDAMLGSSHDDVRAAGGSLGAYAALEVHSEPDLGRITQGDNEVRRGAASTCAHRLPFTSSVSVATSVLIQTFEDDDASVREAASEVAGSLRHRPLRPHAALILALISSRAFEPAVPQLLITLEYARERVDDLILATASQFVHLHGLESASTATRANIDAKQVGDLVLRSYAQASRAADRRRCLDLIDQLLQLSAYGLSEAVDKADR